MKILNKGAGIYLFYLFKWKFADLLNFLFQKANIGRTSVILRARTHPIGIGRKICPALFYILTIGKKLFFLGSLVQSII